MVIGLIIVLILLANEIINYGKIEQSYTPDLGEENYSYGYGHGEGDEITNRNDTYIHCAKDVCNVTIVSWDTPQTFEYTLVVGAGGAGGTWQP